MGRMKDKFTLDDERNAENQSWDVDYDYIYWVDSVLDNKYYFKDFEHATTGLKQLSELVVDDENIQQILWRQIYIGAIGTMEALLADAFINITLSRTKYLRRFVETNPEFKNRKFDMHEVYQIYNDLTKTAKKVMYDTIYHDLSKVRNMYMETFQMKFPDIASASKAVHKRHDLVHRNGKTKSGERILLTLAEVSKTLSIVETLVTNIRKELQDANVDFFDGQD